MPFEPYTPGDAPSVPAPAPISGGPPGIHGTLRWLRRAALYEHIALSLVVILASWLSLILADAGRATIAAQFTAEHTAIQKSIEENTNAQRLEAFLRSLPITEQQRPQIVRALVRKLEDKDRRAMCASLSQQYKMLADPCRGYDDMTQAP